MTLLNLLRRFIITTSIIYALLHLTGATPKENSLAKTYVLYIDEDFSLIERDTIREAANAWERATHGRVKFELFTREVPEFEPFKMLEKAEGMDEFVVWKSTVNSERLFLFELFEVENRIAGYAPPGKNIVLVPERAFSIEHFKTIATHEFGHHIGLHHTPSIMSGTPDQQQQCISKYDLEQFCDVHNCNRKEHTTEVCLD